MEKRAKYMNPPQVCDLCNVPFSKVMYDCATRMGPWGNLCEGCFKVQGVGVGTGKGQKYERGTDGHFYKVAG